MEFAGYNHEDDNLVAKLAPTIKGGRFAAESGGRVLEGPLLNLVVLEPVDPNTADLAEVSRGYYEQGAEPNTWDLNGYFEIVVDGLAQYVSGDTIREIDTGHIQAD